MSKQVNPNLTRRTVMKGAALGAGVLSSSLVGRVLAKGANSKVNIASVGVGGRGRSHLSGCREENIVAICDVDFGYAGGNAKSLAPKAKQFNDYRKLIDDMGKDIDGVTICTPDHIHFPVAMHAMQAGKHVLIEKPLTQTVWEARTLQAAAHKYNVISQMGNQGHATEHIRLGKEWYEAGVLGDVKEVHGWNGGPGKSYFGDPKQFPPPKQETPSTMKWDLWLGPRAERPFSSYYAPRTWRAWWDFGNGPLGDWGCHTLDLPFWALDMGAPTSVQAEVGNVRFAPYIPGWSIVKWEFPARGDKPALTLTWYDGGKKPPNPVGVKKGLGGGGMYMVGDKATMMTGGRPNHGLQLTELEKFQELKKNMPAKTHARIEGDHWKEWIRAIKGTGPKPGSNFDYAAPLSQVLLLGTIAQQVPNKKLLWDNESGRFTNSDEANELVKATPRKGWEYDLS